jgi:nicotinamidase-related amidase
MIELDRDTTALLLVDLQVGVTGMPLLPHSGTDVMAAATMLVSAFRAAKMPVVFVRTSYGNDNELLVRVPNDQNMVYEPPQGWDVLDPRFGVTDADIVVTKHVTSAFHGTDLDFRLRQRGIRTLVVGGVATHVGVESTVWSAYDRSYAQIFVEDAMSAMTADQHDAAVANIFPMIGRVITADEVVEGLEAIES